MSQVTTEVRREAIGAEPAGARALTPRQAAVEVERGAVLVDIRSIDQRRRQGDVPGALTSGLTGLDLDRDDRRTYLLLSATGRRAAAAAAELERRGFLVAYVSGGVRGWEATGLTVCAYRHGQLSSGVLARR